MSDFETMEKGYKAVLVLYVRVCGRGVKCLTAAIWFELAAPFPTYCITIWPWSFSEFPYPCDGSFVHIVMR